MTERFADIEIEPGRAATVIWIRPARLCDVPEIEHLRRRAVRALMPLAHAPEVLASSLRAMGPLETFLIRERTYLVAEIGGRLIGCGGWSGPGAPAEPFWHPALHGDPDAVRMRGFYVEPAWARRGVAGRLLDAAESEVVDRGFERAEVLVSLNATPLYASRGFRGREAVEVRLDGDHKLPAVRMTKAVARDGGERCE